MVKNCIYVTVYIKTDDIYKQIAEDVHIETKLDSSNYELDRRLPKGTNKKVTGLTKDELGGKIKTKFVGLRAETYSYLIDDGSENKKAKDTKNCFTKRSLKSENYKNCSAIQLKKNRNNLEKIKIDIDHIKKIIKNL